MKEYDSSYLTNRKLVVVPGAQKSGTTTLYKLIKDHPEAHSLSLDGIHPLKEPQFFSLTEDTVADNIGWYTAGFSEEEGLFLDCSTSYFINPQAAELIHAYFPDSKIIITLRDPVERTYSGYLQMYTKRPARDRRDFEEVVDQVLACTTDDDNVFESENRILKQAEEQHLVDTGYCGPDYLSRMRKTDLPFKSYFQDPLWPYRYFYHSMYSIHVGRYREYFGANNVLIICMERLLAEPHHVLSEVGDFLGVDFEFAGKLDQHNKTRVPTRFGRLYGLLGRLKTEMPGLDSLSKTWSIQTIKRSIRRYISQDKAGLKENIGPHKISQLRYFFRQEYKYWEGEDKAFKQYWTKKA